MAKKIIGFTPPKGAEDFSLQQKARDFIATEGLDFMFATIRKSPDKTAASKYMEMVFACANFGKEPPKKSDPVKVHFVEIYQDDEGQIRKKEA